MSLKQRVLLDHLQSHFPLTARPYRTLALRLGTSEEDLLCQIAVLKKQGVIRRTGAVVSAQAVHYQTVLLAAAVPRPRIRAVARRLNKMREVTHNYLRPVPYNIWFTLHAATQRELRNLIRQVRQIPGVEKLLVLPQERVYKISAVFPL